MNDDFTSDCHEHRYDRVIVLPPWEEIYITDHERLETFQEAKEIHRFLEDTYAGFKYDSIECAHRQHRRTHYLYSKYFSKKFVNPTPIQLLKEFWGFDI